VVDPNIAEYIRANSEKYTTEAIRDQPLAAGRDPADVDAAVSEWRDAQAEQAADKPVAGRTFWLLAFAIQLAVLGVAAYQLGRSNQTFANGSWIVLAIALLLGVLLTGSIGRALVPRFGLWVGLALPLASALLLGGTCLSMFGVLHP
jgi:hypothetical protein